jgi:hypothetical protein
MTPAFQKDGDIEEDTSGSKLEEQPAFGVHMRTNKKNKQQKKGQLSQSLIN